MFSLLSIFSNWERMVIAGLVIWIGILSGTVFFKDKTITSLNADLNKSRIANLRLNTKLDFQNQEIEKLKVDYENNLNTYNSAKEKIATKYQDKIIKVNRIIYKDGKIDINKEYKFIKGLINEVVDNNISK